MKADHNAQGRRKAIPAATEAALWTLSGGRCYFPTCPFPVVLESRPGVYRKNVVVSHIYGVAPGAPRHRPEMPTEERDSFSNLLLLCLGHSAEVDDRKTGEKQYPPETLHKWKHEREGDNGPALAALGVVSEDQLTDLLLEAFTPPLDRLQQITEQLEQTGTLTASTVAELRQIVDMLSTNATAADTAEAVLHAADIISSRSLADTADALVNAAEILNPRALDIAAGKITGAAEMLSAAVEESRQFGGQM